MKWVLTALLILTIASFGLGFWTSDDRQSADEREGTAVFYLLGSILGAVLVFLVIVTVIVQAFA